MYATVPFDGENKVGEHTFKSSGHPLYTGVGTYRIPGQSGYGTGFSLVPMKVSVGDKWWNGSSWQDTETVFYLKHTNEPDPNSEDDSYEYVDTFKWLRLVPNTTFVQKVGDECYAIPIASNDNDAPSSGRLKIELMIPRFLPLEFTGDIFPTTDNRHQSIVHNWDTKGPCMYIKGFEANIVYVDSTAWWLDSNDKGSDIVYSNVVNSGYCNEFNGLELKINTTVDEKPISKSFINDGDTYIKQMKHYFGDSYKPQEENLIDMYYEHYSKPAKIYTFNANTQLNPYHKFTFGDTLSGTFVLDSYVMDLRNENTEFKVIEYESDLS